MAGSGGGTRVVQAWIELKAQDPEAVSALQVVRSRLPAGREVRSLERLRLMELRGRLPAQNAVLELLHRSSQFYNPHKELCRVRLDPRDDAGLARADRMVLVTERGGERRPAAERWWKHETGQAIEVREGVVWLIGAADPERALEGLVKLRGRREGLLCNPLSEDARVSRSPAPIPWLAPGARARAVGVR